MGSCGSKPKRKGSSGDKSQKLKEKRLSASGSGLQISAQQAAINKKHQDEHKNNLNQVAINWKWNTVGISKRTYDKLAIHTDIPRLGHKIEIIDKLDRLSNINFVNLNTPSTPEIKRNSNSSIENNSNNTSGDHQATQTPQEQSISTSSSSPPIGDIVQNGASEISTPTVTSTVATATPNNNSSSNVDDTASHSQTSFSSVLKENSSNLLPSASDRYTSLTTMNASGQLTTSQVLRKEEVVLQILASLAFLLDGPEKEKHLRKTFPDHVKSNGGDMSQQLLGFLAEIGEDSKVMSLLKVCHQKVILPSYYFIKSNLFEDLPFRDKRGSWKMRIVIEKDQTVTATHSKRQQSTVDIDGEAEFEFEWCLSILFDSDMNISNLKVEVVDLIISQNISQERKSLIQQSFSTLQSATQVTNTSPITPNDPIPLNKIDQ